MYKRGSEEIQSTFTQLVLGVIIVLVLAGFTYILYNAVYGSSSISCKNEADWKSLQRALNRVDNKQFTESQTPFTNEDCYLVSFTKQQPVKIYPDSPKLIPDKPILCLCKIEDNKCKPFGDCYKFSNYEAIISDKKEQFETIKFLPTTFLTFKRENNNLVITTLGAKSNIKNQKSNRTWPVENPILVSCYGERKLIGKTDWHDGLDFRADIDTPVKAVADGKVRFICDKENYNTKDNPDKPSSCEGYGINIILSHSDGTFTRYNHLSEIKVSLNQEIKKGEIIALSGNTGFSEAPHLDFKVYFTEDFSADAGKPSYDRDPLKYLPELYTYTLANSADSCKSSPTLFALKQTSSGVAIV